MLPPAEVVRQAARQGLAAIALTDHDTLAGVPEAHAAGAVAGVDVLSGCEFAVNAPWGEMHLLAYGLPVASQELTEVLASARSARAERAGRIVDRIAELGLTISLAAVEAAAAGAPIGRPHVARALIAAGVVRSIDEAFDRLLGVGRPAYVPKRLPELEAITGLVRRLGGITSPAHLRGRATLAILAELKAKGIDGVEVVHPSHSAAARVAIAAHALELGLLQTGGSDWHGDPTPGPKHRPLGGDRIPMSWVAAIRARCQERRAA